MVGDVTISYGCGLNMAKDVMFCGLSLDDQ